MVITLVVASVTVETVGTVPGEAPGPVPVLRPHTLSPVLPTYLHAAIHVERCVVM